MANFVLNATARNEDKQGKGASRRLRREALVPAIIYGGEAEPVAVTIELRELVKTFTAPVGQSFSHGMQYQHSSNCIKAFWVCGSIASKSSGQTSTQTVHPLSAIHLSSSTKTGATLR